MSQNGYSTFIRAIDVIIGLVLVGLSIYLISDASFAESFIVNAFAIGILLVGLIRTIKGFLMKDLVGHARLTKLILGLAIIGIGIIVLLLPAIAISTLTLLLAVGIMAAGISRIIVGYLEKDLVNWARGLYILVGILVFVLGFIAGVFPIFGFFVLTVMISTAFIALGFVRIISGITGEIR